MPFKAYNNGASIECVDHAYEAADGEILFDRFPTAADLAGAFTGYRPPDTDEVVTFRADAQAALDQSDITILRCYEAGVPVPAEWAAYRAALRAIVGAAAPDPAVGLPDRPDYPAGT